MQLLEEITIEMAMIAAVVVGVVCLADLLQVSIREHLHLRRLEREREDEGSPLVARRRVRGATAGRSAHRARHDGTLAPREKHT